MRALPLLLLGSLLAASAAPAPAPWPVPLHDSANTNCNPSAVLQTRYCPYGLGLDVSFETAVSFPAPDAAYINQLLADERQQLEIFANLAYKNLTKSRNAVNVTLSLPEFNPYSYVWFGTAASGSRVTFIAGCANVLDMVFYAISSSFHAPVWAAQVNECAPNYVYHTYADAIDVLLTTESALLRLSASNGAKVWKSAPLPNAAQSYTILCGLPSGDVLLGWLGSNTVALTLLNGQSGAVRWVTNVTLPHNATGLSAVATANDDVIVVSVSTFAASSLFAYTQSTGKLLWQTGPWCPNRISTTWATVNGASALVAACPGVNSTFAALDPGSGKVIGSSRIAPLYAYAVAGTADSRVVVTGAASSNGTGAAYMLGVFDLATGGFSALLERAEIISQISIDQRGRILAVADDVYLFDACGCSPA